MHSLQLTWSCPQVGSAVCGAARHLCAAGYASQRSAAAGSASRTHFCCSKAQPRPDTRRQVRLDHLHTQSSPALHTHYPLRTCRHALHSTVNCSQLFSSLLNHPISQGSGSNEHEVLQPVLAALLQLTHSVPGAVQQPQIAPALCALCSPANALSPTTLGLAAQLVRHLLPHWTFSLLWDDWVSARAPDQVLSSLHSFCSRLSPQSSAEHETLLASCLQLLRLQQAMCAISPEVAVVAMCSNQELAARQGCCLFCLTSQGRFETTSLRSP
jgi:hypothetical protein